MPDLSDLKPLTRSQRLFRYAITAVAGVALFFNVVSSWSNYRARPLRESASRSLMAERSSFFYASGLSEPVPVAALKAAAALGADPDSAVRAEGVAVFLLLAAVTLAVLWRRFGWACAPLAVMFLACNLYFGYYAMDGASHLYSLLFLVLFWHFFGLKGRLSGALAALAAALACLSRMDAGISAAVIGALSLALDRSPAALKRAALVFGAALLLTAPYLAWQRASYGRFLYAQEIGLRRFANTELLRKDPSAKLEPGPMGPGEFLLRNGAAGAVSGAFGGLGRALAYELPKGVHYSFLFVFIFLGVYAAFTLKKDSLLVFCAGAAAPALPLAAVPAGGLEIRYYLAAIWALCVLAALGLSETVQWIEDFAEKKKAGAAHGGARS